MFKKFTAWLSTFILCFLFWMELVGFSTLPRELIMGTIVSAGAAAFASRFFIHSNAFYMFNPVRLILLLFYGVVIFFIEVIKANIAMVKIVLNPHLSDYNSAIVRIKGSDSIKSEYGLAMVGNSITLTPGTITMDVAEDKDGHNYYYVHWFDCVTKDREKAADMIKGPMEKWIAKIWK